MENSKQKRNSKGDQKNESAEFIHALRSSGMLLPVNDDEVKSFNEIHGELDHELPEKFKNLDFVFTEAKAEIKLDTPSVSVGPTEEIKLAYAARDGQEKLPDYILSQMKEIKNKGRAKKPRGSKK